MTIDRLAGRKGELLRTALAEITEHNSVVRGRLKSFVTWYLGASELRYALRLVTPELWDDVLAWAASSQCCDNQWFEQNKARIDAYLLGATLFEYRSVMGDAFRRISFAEALDDGSRGQSFPFSQIIAVARARTELRGGRGRVVRSLRDEEAIAIRHGRLLTALAQRIPYSSDDEDGFDWDHIFPRGQAHRMWSPGHGGRHRHHPHRHFINSTGNFWALTSSANRSLQDKVGRAKFDQLRQWMASGEGWVVWETSRWSITPAEVERFIAVDEKLNGDPESIDGAMQIFRSTVTDRALRLLQDAFDRFPEARSFARDEDAPKYDPSPAQADYRAALDITSHDADLRALEQPEARNRLRERAKRLLEAVVARAGSEYQIADSWPWVHNGRRASEQAYAAFELAGGNCIELMLRWDASRGAHIDLKAYPHRDKPSSPHLYPDFDGIPLGVPWSASDAEIVEAFAEQAQRLQARYPR